MMDSKKGILFVLTAALISGISIFVNKFAITSIKDPLIFTTLKNTGVALIVLFLLIKSGSLKNIKKLSKKEILTLGLIGIVGGSLPFYLFFKGLSMTSALNGAIIQKTLVLWVGILAFYFLKEKMSKTGWFTIIVLFVANAFVGGFKGFEYSKGEFYILTATLMWAVETVISKRLLSRFESNLVVTARMGIGAVVLFIMSLIINPKALFGVANLSFDNWLWILLTTFILVGYVTAFYGGLKYVSATVATGMLVASTLITNVLSAFFVTHTLNSQLITQSLVIGAGIYLLYKFETKSQKSTSPGLTSS